MKNSARKLKKKSPAEVAKLAKKLARREKLTCGKRLSPPLIRAKKKEQIVDSNNKPLNQTHSKG